MTTSMSDRSSPEPERHELALASISGQPLTPRMSTVTGLALAVVSGILASLADYPRPVPALAWFAVAPVLIAAHRRGARAALWLGVTWGCITGIGPAREALVGIPLPIVVPLMAGRALLIGAVLAVTVLLARRVSVALTGWIFAAAVVGVEWALEAAGLGLFLTLSSLQASVEWVRVTSAVGGPYLVSFLVALVNGSLAALVIAERRAAVTAAASTVVALAAAAIAGPLAVPAPSRTVRVAAVVHQLPAGVLQRWEQRQVRSEETWEAVAAYEALTRRVVSAGASVVVWPEYGVFVRDGDLAPWQDHVTTLARETGAVIVAGYVDVDGRWIRALLAAPSGDATVYSKQALVPGLESWLQRGSEPFGEVHGAGLRVATRICYDLDFTGGSRAAGRAGVELLAVPSIDWPSIAERHAMQSVFRAAENGVAMVRATQEGWSMIVDPAGRVLASASDADGGDVLLVGDVPIARAGTVYSWAGDWVVGSAGVGLLAVALVALASRRRQADLPARPTRRWRRSPVSGLYSLLRSGR